MVIGGLLVVGSCVIDRCCVLIVVASAPGAPPVVYGPVSDFSSIVNYSTASHAGWLDSRVVSVLDSSAEGLGFRSQPRCCWVTVLGKLFTLIVCLFTKQRNW